MLAFALFYQGSAKLEKAEILQMTVDHLKLLQATGGKGNQNVSAAGEMKTTSEQHQNFCRSFTESIQSAHPASVSPAG